MPLISLILTPSTQVAFSSSFAEDLAQPNAPMDYFCCKKTMDVVSWQKTFDYSGQAVKMRHRAEKTTLEIQ